MWVVTDLQADVTYRTAAYRKLIGDPRPLVPWQDVLAQHGDNAGKIEMDRHRAMMTGLGGAHVVRAGGMALRHGFELVRCHRCPKACMFIVGAFLPAPEPQPKPPTPAQLFAK